jgi:hypothetical protein
MPSGEWEILSKRVREQIFPGTLAVRRLEELHVRLLRKSGRLAA